MTLMQNFTHFDFEELSEEETKLFAKYTSQETSENKAMNIEQKKPTLDSIKNILNYSKAYSARASRQIGFIENILN